MEVYRERERENICAQCTLCTTTTTTTTATTANLRPKYGVSTCGEPCGGQSIRVYPESIPSHHANKADLSTLSNSMHMHNTVIQTHIDKHRIKTNYATDTLQNSMPLSYVLLSTCMTTQSSDIQPPLDTVTDRLSCIKIYSYIE